MTADPLDAYAEKIVREAMEAVPDPTDATGVILQAWTLAMLSRLTPNVALITIELLFEKLRLDLIRLADGASEKRTRSWPGSSPDITKAADCLCGASPEIIFIREDDGYGEHAVRCRCGWAAHADSERAAITLWNERSPYAGGGWGRG